jgi:hypothetical protein
MISPAGQRSKDYPETIACEALFVLEIRRDYRPHRLRHRRALDQRPVRPVPDRTGTRRAALSVA